MKLSIWTFSLPLRILVWLCASATALIYLLFLQTIIQGNTEMLFLAVDIDGNYDVLPWQKIAGFITVSVNAAAVLLISYATNKFLVITRRDGFFAVDAPKILTYFGCGMILFWLGLILVEDLLPWILTKNLSSDLQVELEWIPFDHDIVALAVGFVFLLMSKALDEARYIDQEHRKIV